jgi:uncharacterized damage-inducible protein DinB
MQVYRAMVEYDRWANRKVFGLCRDLDADALGAEAKGTHSTIERTLKHLVGVSEAFLAMLRDQELREVLMPPKEYYGNDLAWFERRADENADRYEALLGAVDEAFFDAQMKIPWFDHKVTKRDAFLQSLTHALQHRSQVCSTLGERGVAIPDMDYVHMRQER